MLKTLKRWLGAAAVVLGMGLAGPSEGANAISAVTHTKARNFSSVAVQAIVTGDDDSNAVCRIFHRVYGSGASYDTGMVMQRRPGTRTFSGRILHIPEGKTADFYVQATDGTPQTSTADSASFLGVPINPVTATPYYVDGTNGDDANTGFSRWDGDGTVGPKRTIQAAVNALAAAGGTTGTAIYVLPGEYHETVQLGAISGLVSGRQYTLAGLGGRDSVIICGANPNVEAGRYDATNAIVWTRLTTDPDAIAAAELATDSVFYCIFPSEGGPADSTQLIVLGWGEYLHRKTSLWSVMRDSAFVPSGCGSSSTVGERSGWFWSGDTLYVKSATGATPTVEGNHFGYREQIVKVYSRGWTIRDLSIRFGGSQRTDNTATEAAYKAAHSGAGCGTGCQAGKPAPPLQGAAILCGVSSVSQSGASGMVLYNVRMYGTNTALINAPRYAVGIQTDSVTIANCIFDQLTVGSMHYAAAKCHTEEQMSGLRFAGRNWNVVNSRFLSLANGVASTATVAGDSTDGLSCEISGNTFEKISDDGLELDNTHALNFLVYNNIVKTTLTGVSFTGCTWGTLFFIYNRIFYTARGVKLGGSVVATSHFYHNTIVPDPSASGTRYALDGEGGAHQHMYYTNNLFMAPQNIAIEGVGAGSDSLRYHTSEFNWNFHSSTSSSANVQQWFSGPTAYTKTGIAGWGANSVTENPTLAGQSSPNAMSTYDVTPATASSLIIDAGRRLTGVNTGFGVNRYTTSPDIGFAEYNLQFVTRKSWLNRLLRRK